MLSAFSAGRAPAPVRPIARAFALLAAMLAVVAAAGCGLGGPSQDDPDAYTKQVVQDAIDRYEADGQARTLRYYNTEESVDGQWYVFIIGEDNSIRAIHPKLQQYIGEDVATAQDKAGYPHGPVIASASESGRWVTYLSENPARSNRVQTKHVWVVRHEGLIFGSGWYDPEAESNPVLPIPAEEPDAEEAVAEEAAPPKDEPDAYAKHLVRQAIERYEADGRQDTLGYFNRAESADGPWYVWVAGEDDTILSHPTIPEFVGQTVQAVSTDSTGYYFGDIMAAASRHGRWVTYLSTNPATGLEQPKHAWVVRHDGLLFGSGWYEQPDLPVVEVPEREDVDAYTKYVVDLALNRYAIEGREATIEYYNTEASVDGEWYVFIADEDHVLVSHATIPENRGLSLVGPLGIDITGYAFGPVMVSAGESGRWVSYVFLNPATGQMESKHAWVVRRYGLLFGSGWYEATPDVTAPVPSKSQPDVYTKYFVQQAIDYYAANGREATIARYNSRASVDGEWYVFIADENDILVSHPTVPERRGRYLRDPATFTDITGYFYGPVLAGASDLGRWVTYQFLNPAIGQVGTKHSWAIRHDGLLFGSGWYE